jgi:hypothetical protein
MAEAPNAFNDAVLGFLAEVDTAAAATLADGSDRTAASA